MRLRLFLLVLLFLQRLLRRVLLLNKLDLALQRRVVRRSRSRSSSHCGRRR